MANEDPKNKREESAEGAAPEPKKGKGKFKALALVGGLMLGEGIGIFAVMKMLYPSAPAHAEAEEHPPEDEDPFHIQADCEVMLCELDAANRRDGRSYIYHMQLSVLVAKEDQERITAFVEARQMSVKDRIQAVVRNADPADLNDPTLDNIKRQLQSEMNNLLGGKEIIKAVLISKMLQSRGSV